MATLIHVDGTEEEIKRPEGLEAMQKLVGGMIQMVNLPKGEMLMCDEEGKFKDYEVNKVATARWEVKAGVPIRDVLVGDVVFFTKKEVKAMES
jgi:hypothetical protein